MALHATEGNSPLSELRREICARCVAQTPSLLDISPANFNPNAAGREGGKGAGKMGMARLQMDRIGGALN